MSVYSTNDFMKRKPPVSFYDWEKRQDKIEGDPFKAYITWLQGNGWVAFVEDSAHEKESVTVARPIVIIEGKAQWHGMYVKFIGEWEGMCRMPAIHFVSTTAVQRWADHNLVKENDTA